jgi:formylglycine-generating enzyme required for sulfatase activity
LFVPRQAFEPQLIALPGGEFWMGSPDGEADRARDEGPRHQVRIAPFAIGQTAVTFAQYDAFAQATGRVKPSDNGWGRGDRPVINVSWEDAVSYAAWLSRETGEQYRLPSEAEWEYAARAGTETPFWTGPCIHTDQANYDGNFDYNGCGANTGVYREKTVPVGSLPANPWGLHEVHGNVWEWVQDRYQDNYRGAPTDGSAWEAGGSSARVVRGGSWLNVPRDLRAANRNGDGPDNRDNFLGFRLARTLSP